MQGIHDTFDTDDNGTVLVDVLLGGDGAISRAEFAQAILDGPNRSGGVGVGVGTAEAPAKTTAFLTQASQTSVVGVDNHVVTFGAVLAVAVQGTKQTRG